MKLRCQICGEWIAVVDEKALAYPMRGSMFKSVDPHHGVEAPFPPSADWEFMKCPWGPHRPMIKDNEIATDQGVIVVWPKERDLTPGKKYKVDATIDKDGARATIKEVKSESIKDGTEDVRVRGVQQGVQDGKGAGRVSCEICGKEYDKEINLSRHKSMAHKGA